MSTKLNGQENMRVALGVEYDGSGFHGWQIQEDVRSVQQVLEQAVSRVANHPVRVHCAGRTDTGVHATAQVVHFETDAVRTDRSWVLGSNVNLPDDVNVSWAKVVPDDFHARFSAVGRHYRYLILNRFTRSGLHRHRAVWVHQRLSAEPMQQAAQVLVGEHDFSSFRALGCQAKSPVRTIHRLEVSRHGDVVEINAHANAFLHHMVRNIAGVLIAIGRGDRPMRWASDILRLRDRTRGGVTAPAEGLYLVGVDYPAQFEIPQPPATLF